MQWIHSNCIHSGEYFHGPFEVTDFDVPFVLVKGIGATRELDERAYNFCSKFSQKLAVIDEAEFDLTGIEPGVQEYVAPLLYVADGVLISKVSCFYCMKQESRRLFLL